DSRTQSSRAVAADIAVGKEQARHAMTVAPAENPYATSIVVSEQHDCLNVVTFEPADDSPALEPLGRRKAQLQLPGVRMSRTERGCIDVRRGRVPMRIIDFVCADGVHQDLTAHFASYSLMQMYAIWR